MSNIVKFKPNESADDPDVVIKHAIGVYKDVVIFGTDHNGDMECRANTSMTNEEVLWIIQKFVHKLLDGDYE